MKIRRLVKNDSRNLSILLQEFYNFTLKNLPDDFQPFMQFKNESTSIANWVKENYLKNRIVYVAEDQGKLAGFLCATIRHKKGVIYSKEGHIENLFVSLSYRHKGIGTELFQTIIKEFKQLKCSHIGLFAFVNNKNAINFYRSLGLKEFDMQLKMKLEYEK